jgi:hypothetical protein
MTTRRLRFLTQTLLISGALNIGLLATFIYFVLEAKKVTFLELESKAASSLPETNQQILHAYSTLSFQELLIRLDVRDLAEEGYSKRDLALSCLVAFHHFNLEKALGGDFFQKRKIIFKNGQEMIEIFSFPGLSEEQYQAIVQYVRTEKWPFTTQGLFFEIQHLKEEADPSLLEAFYLTPEFHAVKLLFVRSGISSAKEAALKLLLSGEWALLKKFFHEQKQAQNFTPQRLLIFLIEYLHRGSSVAAQLLLETEFEFACKRLDDPHVLLLLDLVQEKNKIVESFAKSLLLSPRSDAVWKRAAALLFSFEGESLPEPYDHAAALSRFFPQSAPPPEKMIQSEEKREEKVHTVQEGESLWKIARRYKIPIDVLIQHNQLASEKLKVGKKLRIPVVEKKAQGTGS